MEPRTRAHALTVAAVALTAGFTLGTTLLPSSAHAAEHARGASTSRVTTTPTNVISSDPTRSPVSAAGA
ncbi:hypothetical protein DN069_24370 [Streptacidiphilus pinicola]|uniref:Uncharacterized protein n=1 Tax=Streptacidiphilus pinicola TaxID=2219663 RepID=A0A2X0K6Y6_9ACTN|nr:hypothetical protein [Streptacidiphilus pinicola]RAG83010.1 hypothetical protein DN069_24370 [Streptacidiphilus pinicola]